MTCKDCGSERLANVGGKCSDLGNLYVPHLDIDIDGYHPNIKGICSSDYIDLGFCLECGRFRLLTSLLLTRLSKRSVVKRMIGMSDSSLPYLLRKIADELSNCEPNSYWDTWMMLINEMNKGNPAWNKDMTGKSSMDAARDEIQRLYAIDKTVRTLKIEDLGV